MSLKLEGFFLQIIFKSESESELDLIYHLLQIIKNCSKNDILYPNVIELRILSGYNIPFAAKSRKK